MDGVTDRFGRQRLRWRFGDFCLDETSLQLVAGATPVELERRPLLLLALLLAHAGEIVTKDEILEALWPGREVSEASLTTCMARLRQALGEVGHSAIRTVHGYGYRFMAAVQVEAVAPAATVPAEVSRPEAGEAVPGRPSWRFVTCLGTGGFGEVWLVEHAGSRERRALKLALGETGAAGLRREVALWRLLREGLGVRPDLIRLLDWSFAATRPFVEMEWAEQGNLAAWAARQGGLGAVPLATRLDLAAQIADALAAIHVLGVLHNDLKPANVLIRLGEAEKPSIILTDFGCARALDPARLDAFGITRPNPDPTLPQTSAGTHAYRAPESVLNAPLTAQSDIFSLGVMLFQLVACDLRRPLTAGWEDAIADPLLREDIAAAAAGDPAKRLAEAGLLASRLRALPERRLARARAEEAAARETRARRILEINRARRAARLTIAAVLIAGLAATSFLYVRAERARKAAEAAEARAEGVTAFLTDDFFSAANPLLMADPNIPLRRLLGVAVADLGRRFPDSSPDRAAIEAAIGGAYAGLADTDHALPLLHDALPALREALGDDNPRTQAVRLALASLAEHRMDPRGMREAGQAILDTHPAAAQTELRARLFILLGGCAASGNSEACVASLKPFLAEAEHRLGARDPLVIRAEAELARQMGDAQQFDTSVPLARAAIEATIRVFGPDHLLVQERRFDLAQILVQAGQTEAALGLLQDIRQHVLLILAGETEFSARVLNQIGMADFRAGKYADGLAAYRAVLDYSTRAEGETASLSIAAMNNMAQTLAKMGRTQEAIGLAEKALDMWRRTVGPDAANTLRAERNLAMDCRQSGDLRRAETLLRDVVARSQRIFTHGEHFRSQYEAELAELLAEEAQAGEKHPKL
jgi:non-specific serine/threonine protein kinase